MTHPGFSDHEARALSAVLDQIIPPSRDGRLPGAGELGLVRHIEQVLEKAPQFTPMLRQGLSAIDELARVRDAEGFATLLDPEKLEVLQELTSTEPGFLPLQKLSAMPLDRQMGYNRLRTATW